VDHEREVRLVEAHAEGGRRHQRGQPVGLEVRLERLPLRRFGAAGVRAGVVPCGSQGLGHLLRGGHGEAVDDAGAGAGEVGEVRREPRQPARLVGQADDAEVKRGAVQAAAQHEHVLAVAGELLGDVGRDPGVRRRRGGQDADSGRQAREQVADAPVVRAEVVAPVGDAVRLVHHHEPGVPGEPREHLVAEARVVQPLRRAEEHVHLARGDRRMHLAPLRDVGRVDRHRTDPGAGRGRDLVPHEGEQRGDDDGGTRSACPEQGGRDEVDGRLPPPRALDHEGPSARHHERLDGGPLVLTQRRIGPADQRPERGLRLGPEACGGFTRSHRASPRIGRGRRRSGRGGRVRGNLEHACDATPSRARAQPRVRNLWTTPRSATCERGAPTVPATCGPRARPGRRTASCAGTGAR